MTTKDRKLAKFVISLCLAGFLYFLISQTPSAWQVMPLYQTASPHFIPRKNQRALVPLDFGSNYGGNKCSIIAEIDRHMAQIEVERQQMRTMFRTLVARSMVRSAIEQARRGSNITNTSAPNSCQKRSLRQTPGPKWLRASGSFQKVGNGTYVYSAYYDASAAGTRKDQVVVHVTGVSDLRDSAYCHVWHRVSETGKRALEVVRATFTPRPHLAKYSFIHSLIHSFIHSFIASL